MIEILANIVAVFSIFALIYVFFLYPSLIRILSIILNKPLETNKDYKPELTVLISFYNEEKLIEDCIRSVYTSGYPKEKIIVIAASDGSSDDSVRIVKELQKEYRSLQLIEFGRSGKNKVLNKIAPLVQTELLFYLDADSRPQIGALESMVLKFSDANVGALISSLQFGNELGENAGGQGEKIYQTYEGWIRDSESRIYSTVNSLGSFYAIKKKYYKPLTNDLLADDFQPLLDVIEAGGRVIFDTDAITNEVRGKSLIDECSRRVRTSAAGLSTLWHAKKLLSPVYGWTAFFLWSHKLLRWLSPCFLLLLLFSTAFMSYGTTFFYIIAILQLVLYSFAFIGWILEKFSVSIFIFKMCLYFITMNIGFFKGIIGFLSKKQNALWDGHIY